MRKEPFEQFVPSIKQLEKNEGAIEQKEIIDDKESQGFKLMEKFHRLGKSVFGKGLLFFFVAGGLKFGVDYYEGALPENEAWLEFSKSHPKIERIHYKNLNEVPTEKRDDVFKIRNEIYYLRLNDAITTYQEGGKKKIPQNVLDAVKQFNPSRYDRELEKMGLGSLVKINKPLPALQFIDPDEMFKNYSAPSGDLVGKFVSKNDDDLFNRNMKEDVIYLSPSGKYPEDEIHQIFLHEYLHSIQYRQENGSEKRLLKPFEGKSEGYRLLDEHGFTEGVTDLLRLELNRHLGKKSLGMSYPGKTFAVFEIMRSLGEEKFLKLFSEGDLTGIVNEFDKIHGVDTAKELLDSFYGGAAICNPSWWTYAVTVFETFDKLGRKGLLVDNHFQEFNQRYDLNFPKISDKFIRSSDGSTIGFVNIIHKNQIEIGVKNKKGETHDISDDPNAEVKNSIKNFPELNKLWKLYLSSTTSDDRRLAVENIKKLISESSEELF